MAQFTKNFRISHSLGKKQVELDKNGHRLMEQDHIVLHAQKPAQPVQAVTDRILVLGKALCRLLIAALTEDKGLDGFNQFQIAVIVKGLDQVVKAFIVVLHRLIVTEAINRSRLSKASAVQKSLPVMVDLVSKKLAFKIASLMSYSG